MGKLVRFLGGLLLGAALGAGLVLILTPQSGAGTRRLVQNRVQEVLDEGRRAAEERRLELTAQLEARVQPR